MDFRNPSDFVKWHYGLEDFPIVSRLNTDLLSKYFSCIIEKLNDKRSREEIFVSEIFHSIMGMKLLNTQIKESDIANIESFIMQCWTGKGFTPVVKNSNIGRLLKTQELPEDIYSTYYCLGSLTLMGKDIKQFLKPISSEFITYFQSSGWIYNSDWANTDIERRFDIELSQQVLMATRIALILGKTPNRLPYHKERCQKLITYLKKPRYISAIYYIALCLLVMNEWNDQKESIADRLAKFISMHFCDDELGFREYQMENVKIFSYRGMGKEEKGASAKHRFHSDHVEASINATTYTLWMAYRFIRDDLLKFVVSKKEKIVKYYFKQISDARGGYGSPIKIAKYDTFFGPSTTAVETCNYIIGAGLADTLS